MPFWVGDPLIRHPFVNVSVAPMVPLLVTASACWAVVAVNRMTAQVKRRFLFIYHPPEDVSVHVQQFSFNVQDVSPAKCASEGVIENLVYGYRFDHPRPLTSSLCLIDALSI